jgi:hypothetical protein
MGRAKEQWTHQQELGFTSVGDNYVCAACFEDYAIQNFIQDNISTEPCSYCGGKDATAIDEVLEFIAEGIRTEWGNPGDEGISWESREGGWQWPVLDSYELIFDKIGLEVGEALEKDIAHAFFGGEWVERNPYVLPQSQTLIFGWQRFVDLVKHHTRYVFYAKLNPPVVIRLNQED